MKNADRFELAFVAYTGGLRRNDKEAAWRICTLKRRLTATETARCAESLKTGDVIHVGNVGFVHLGVVGVRGRMIYVFEPAGVTREIEVRGHPMPILPSGLVDFAELLLRMKNLGYKVAIGKPIRATPFPRRSRH